MKKKKKGLRERARELYFEADDRITRLVDRIPVWKARDGLNYHYLPGDMMAYLHRYEPKKAERVTKIAEIVTAILLSVIGSLLGVKLAVWYFTTHILPGA